MPWPSCVHTDVRQPDARVQQGVGEVDEQLDEHREDGGDQHGRLDQRVVAAEDRGRQQAAEPRVHDPETDVHQRGLPGGVHAGQVRLHHDVPSGAEQVAGVHDHLEIWDRTAWAAHVSEIEGSADDVAERLATQRD